MIYRILIFFIFLIGCGANSASAGVMISMDSEFKSLSTQSNDKFEMPLSEDESISQLDQESCHQMADSNNSSSTAIQAMIPSESVLVFPRCISDRLHYSNSILPSCPVLYGLLKPS